MAIKYVRIGSSSQVFGYDDSVFPTAISTDSPIEINAAPTDSSHALRLADIGGITIAAISVANIDDPSTELNALTGDATSLVLVYQIGAGANASTLYTWDNAITGSENVPYIVDGATGYWISIGGKYCASAVNFGDALHHIGTTLGFFNTAVTTKTAVADPSAVATTQTAGATYTANEQTMLANLKSDVTALQSKLTSLIDALQSYGLV